MRTRIALVAITPIALISTCVPLALAGPPAAAAASPQTPISTSSATTLGPFDVLASHRLTLAPAVVPTPVVAPPPPPVPAPVPAGPVDTVTPYQREAWERVAVCEEGGDWQAGGGEFSGGLGITRSNWAAYGGLQYASEGGLATEDEQIMVAERIQFSPPDQDGCSSW